MKTSTAEPHNDKEQANSKKDLQEKIPTVTPEKEPELPGKPMVEQSSADSAKEKK